MKTTLTPLNKNLKGIYQIFNLINNDFYIGSTRFSFQNRFCKHKSIYKNFKLGKRNYHPILFAAFDKYGIENFEFRILELETDNVLILEKEERYIKSLKPKYNICQEPTKGGRPNLDRKLSEAWRKKIGEKSKLYKHSKEVKALKSQQNKDLSSVYQIFKGGVLLVEDSLINCANFLKIHPSTIHNVFYKKYKSEYEVFKIKSQKKKIKLFLFEEEIILDSFGKCDKYLGMWRGFTSTMILRNESTLKGLKYEVI